MKWFHTGRIVGVVSGLVTLGFVAILVLSPAYPPPSPFTVLTGVLAIAVIAASVAGSPGILVFAFVASFLPLGLYFLLTPGIFKWLGIGELGYLLAATFLFYGGKSRPLPL